MMRLCEPDVQGSRQTSESLTGTLASGVQVMRRVEACTQ
jgi:hypothetical protein